MDRTSTPSDERSLQTLLEQAIDHRLEQKRQLDARIAAQRSASSAPPDDSPAPAPAK